MTAAPGTSMELMNRRAWNVRWRSRRDSRQGAASVLRAADDRDTHSRAKAQRTLAWHGRWCGDFDTAQAHADACLSLIAPGTQTPVRADALAILAVVDYSRGFAKKAAARVDLGLRMIETRSRVDTRIELLTTRATILRYQGAHTEARTTMARALELAEGAERARVHHNIARAYESDNREDTQTGLSHAMLGLSDARRFENRVILPYALEMVGTCYRRLGARGQARRYLREAADIGAADGDTRVRCQALHQIALNEDADGDLETALLTAEEGACTAAQLSYPLWEQRFLHHLARLREATGDIAGALDAMKRLYALAQRPGLPRVAQT